MKWWYCVDFILWVDLYMYKCNKNKTILQTTYLQVVVRKQYWYIVNRCNHFLWKAYFTFTQAWDASRIIRLSRLKSFRWCWSFTMAFWNFHNFIFLFGWIWIVPMLLILFISLLAFVSNLTNKTVNYSKTVGIVFLVKRQKYSAQTIFAYNIFFRIASVVWPNKEK